VSLGNNHIENMDEAGVLSTRAYLEEAGVAHFGGLALLHEEPTDVGEPVHRMELEGQRLSFIAYNQFGGMAPQEVSPRIASEKAGGYFVVVMAHWGEEYVPPVQGVREAARLFAEAGAGLIIGSHPHVVQESETIGETRVYYSLGNFLFDQFFSEEVRHGLAVEAIFKDGTLVSITELPTTMLQEERRVCFDADLPGA
jgi:gamma-polyglutamate biosynthesis protein CapA